MAKGASVQGPKKTSAKKMSISPRNDMVSITPPGRLTPVTPFENLASWSLVVDTQNHQMIYVSLGSPHATHTFLIGNQGPAGVPLGIPGRGAVGLKARHTVVASCSTAYNVSVALLPGRITGSATVA